MPWLVFPPAVDLANTVVVDAGRPVDMLTTDDELAAWAALESGRIPEVEATAGQLVEVRALRDDVRALLFAAAGGRPLPSESVNAINDASAGALSYPVLRENCGRDDILVADDPFARFRSAIARSVIDVLAGDDRRRLDVCHAPSCGMLFLRRGGAQKWCCDACGNRARVASHARRRRARSTGVRADERR
jgi:predicted RNA-binding Zn ribbon-like protein